MTEWYDWWELEKFSELLYKKPPTTEILPLQVRHRNQFVAAGLGLSSFDKLTEVDFDQFIERMRLSEDPQDATIYPFNKFKLKLVIHKKGLETETQRPKFECKTIEDTPVPDNLKKPFNSMPLTPEQKKNQKDIDDIRYLRMVTYAGTPTEQLDAQRVTMYPPRTPIPSGNIVGGRHRKSRRYTRKYKKSNKRVKSAKRLRSANSRKYRK